jgi:mono/diheme cytochrome c family protein
MSEVVTGSTQHLNAGDLNAMADYLRALPASDATPLPDPDPPYKPSAVGAKLYEQHCAACHGEQGQGVQGAYPALARNRALLLDSTANLVHIILEGGFAPSTAGNPRPFGMPPFATVLNDNDVAALLTFLRASWGNQAPPVSAVEVGRFRSTSR